MTSMEDREIESWKEDYVAGFISLELFGQRVEEVLKNIPHPPPIHFPRPEMEIQKY